MGALRRHLVAWSTLAVLAAVAPCAAIARGLSSTPAGCTVPTSGLVDSGPSDRPLVSITYDEHLGPNTRPIVDTFDEYGMHGTFFTVGREVDEHPRLGRLILRRGDELGDHSYSHIDLTALPDYGFAQYRRAQRAIRRAAGFTTCLARPPQGHVNDDVVDAATRLGMTTVMWGTSPSVWDSDPDHVAEVVLYNAKPGSIVLLHQTDADTEALPRILRGLRHRGLTSVPVTELLGGELTSRAP